MIDLIGEGLRAQQQIVNANHTRIVRGDELLADVHFEAQMRGCSVWADPKARKAIISRNRPNESYIKVHVKAGTVRGMFGRQDGPAAA